MDFLTLYTKVVQNALNYGQKYSISIDEEFALMKLMEEMGEFSQALLIYKRKSRPEKFLPDDEAKEEVAKELADVVGMAFVTAHVLDINIEQALNKKWIKN